MDMKKLFHVLVVGGAVIGTGGGCAKPKAAEGTAAPPAQTTPSTTAAPSTPTNGSDAPGTPAAPPAKPEEKGGGAGSW
jgi:hypothetical protein